MIERTEESGIGYRIYSARKSKGLTLQDVADLLGVSKATVSKYETNVIKDFQFDKVIPVCKLLGISPNILFGWEEDKTESRGKEQVLNNQIVFLQNISELLFKHAYELMKQTDELKEKIQSKE